MMSHLQSVHRYLLLALVGAVWTACATTAATAQAATYGQVGHFGSKGTGSGQFTITTKTHAFGVDPTDSNVYVGDVPSTGVFRIQKLSAAGEFLASVSFTPTPPVTSIEGVAIAPAEKRIYVLAVHRRLETSTIDPSRPAAGTLYAFSTEAQGNKLIPASGANAEGVLADQSVLGAQAEIQEQALLEPRGIAVDPKTHDVIILGSVDQGAPEGHEPQERIALQRVHSNGTLGERYIDSKQFFSEETPDSPVVSQTGNVFVQHYDQIVQIPSDFASTDPPIPLFQFESEGPLQEELLEFDTPTTEPSAEGGGLSLLPEGATEGTIYANGRIDEDVEEGQRYPGVLAFKYTERGEGLESSEVGWTGGESKKNGAGKCTIGLNSINPNYPMVAAGEGSTVFVFDPSVPQIVEFGPGGEGCAPAEATEPEGTINGRQLSPSETVSAGTPVTFSSKVKQANALSVEWDFGDGQTMTVGTDEHRHIEVTHKFIRGGILTVTETIHTDDLATPTMTKATKISVSTTAPPPTAVLEGPSEITLDGGAALGRLVYLEDGGLGLEEAAQSEEATFDASASYASTVTGANRIESYHWAYGDGESETTASAIVRHKYKKAGVYKVELTVTDMLGLTSEPSTLTLKVNEPPPKGPASVAGSPGPIQPEAPAATTGHASPAAGAHAPPPVPDARLAATSIAVDAAGAIHLDVTCPTGESSCTGTVTLRSIGAIGGVAAHKPHGHTRRKANVLTLATGTFEVAGGRKQSVKLRLSARARTLLTNAHALRVRATVAAHDPAGAMHTSQTTVTLHAPTTAHGRGKG